mmetsp:Transcript_4860/g.6818  ORF Transcript_4860/g.6818 Transcript_4860/m.6818 type:complete len:291 (+) Transcript_4860:214-1086(+)
MRRESYKLTCLQVGKNENSLTLKIFQIVMSTKSRGNISRLLFSNINMLAVKLIRLLMRPSFGNNSYSNIKLGHINLTCSSWGCFFLLLLWLFSGRSLPGSNGCGNFLGFGNITCRSSYITLLHGGKTLIVEGWELLQESFIILVKFTNISNSMNDHGKTLHTESSSKSRILVRINTSHFEYIWIDHTTSQYFKPLATEEHIYLHTRLRERKVRSTETYINLRSKHFSQEVLHCSLQMTNIQLSPLIQCQNLNLMKNHRMRRIDIILAVHTSRGNHPQRRLPLAQLPNLHS